MNLNFSKIESNVEGLKYIPWFSSEINQLNFEDSHQVFDHYVQALHPEPPLYHGHPTFTPANCAILEDCLRNLGTNCRAIMEIGIARDHPIWNSTKILLDNRPEGCKYLGVDIRDLSQYHKPELNQHVLKSDSRHQNDIRAYLHGMGVNQLDFLFIDGHHSMEMFLNDWRYSDLVRSGGYVLYHDVSHHPGPYMFYDAIDENLYEKSKHCLYDYGMAVCRKR
jgi:hypothetical protein